MIRSALLALSILLLAAVADLAAGEGPYVRTPDVVYGRKHGMALTLDVFRPTGARNGLGVLYMISGGWYSNHDFEGTIPNFLPLLMRGYTVFAVVHGSQPRFTIPEVIQDVHRAVRFVRFHARQHGIDPARLGITGMSAGGHLSLMQGVGGRPGDPAAKDPVDRVASGVQAVACFFPPTDFLNYGAPGHLAIGRGTLKDFAAPFDFQEFDSRSKRFERIADQARILALARDISPITHVSAASAPTLIIHGDADRLVPIQQAESFIAKLTAAGVQAKLLAKPGAAHGWWYMGGDLTAIGDWFDAHLKQAP